MSESRELPVELYGTHVGELVSSGGEAIVVPLPLT